MQIVAAQVDRQLRLLTDDWLANQLAIKPTNQLLD